MAREIYQTEGLILGGTNFGEASRMVSVLTRDFGLVRAVARSARKNTAKLNAHLQKYDYSRVSLVAGREVWRITDAEKISSVANPLSARVFSLLTRLIHGQLKHHELYDTVHYGLLNGEDEITLVLKILKHLGYLKEDPATLSQNRAQAIFQINRSLEHAML